MSSPLHCLPEATLTPSGLLQLDVNDGEVELMRRSGMELRSEEPIGEYSGTWIDRDVDLTVTLTTHRLVFQGPKQSRFLHLSNIHLAEATGGASLKHWNASYKLLLNTYSLGELVLVFRSNKTSPLKDRDDLLQLIAKTLERRAWEASTRLQEKKRASQQIAKRKVGVDAIMTKNALRHKEAARLADEALSGDSEQLLREAAELVAIIHKYVATIQKNSDDQDEDAKQLAGMLQDMGMTSALTKQDLRGGEYHQIVARQVADFIVPKLQKMGGIMTLTDVFCLFNRARGTNLISPEDLLKAMQITKELELGIFQREFPSGIKVVQLDSWDDEAMAKKLLELCEQATCLTSLQASRELQTPAILAYEHLLLAERAGYLCRDTTLETTRFYINKFNDFKW